MAVRAEQQSHPSRAATDSGQIVGTLMSSLLVLTAIVAFAIAAMASVVVGYGLYYQNQVYPGVQAVGVDIGGVSRADAEAALDQKTDSYLQNELTFVHDDRVYHVDPATLGIEFDNSRTVDNAYAFGRGGNWWTDSWDWLDSLVFGHDVGVYSSIDVEASEAFFRSIASEITVHPQEPEFRVTDSGQLELTEAAEGVGIDVPTTVRDLRRELNQLGGDEITIATTSVAPSFDETILEPLYDRMATILAGPLIIEQEGFQWSLDPHLLRSLLIVSVDLENDEANLAIDTERIERHVSAFADEARSPGRDARVRWNGEEFEVTQSTDGWLIDVDGSVASVEQAILNGEHRVQLASTPQPATITTEAAEDAARFGNDLIDSRFELNWDDGETDLGGSVIAATMTFEPDVESGEFVPEINVDDLALFLTSISRDVEIEPVNANLRYYDGEVVVVDEEEPGRVMDRHASAESIAEAVKAGELSAEIVVNDAEPEVTAAMADEIEIREMLSYGETYYANSAENRAHNVELATERANGALVPPGGEYSFVDTIGDISIDSGYELGFGIIGATDGGVTTVPSVGGGVCQVSTTIFQAAFWAGFPMVERNWHLYWMPLYGQDPTGMTGLDATVDTSAGLDFKFTNTTDDWIAIVATADGNANRFEIWGTDPGWDVDAEGPHISNRVTADREMQYEETDRLPAGTRTQVETAHDGFDVLIERWVYDSDGELIDELKLESQYRPASNRTLIGTGD